MASRIIRSGLSKASAAAILTFTIAVPSLAETIKIGGTGAALGTMKQLGDAFQKRHPEHAVTEVPSLGSTGGIKALQAGAIEVAVTGRDLKPEEKSSGLSAIRYGTTPFVFAAHPQAPALRLTKESIADIYSGKQANWPDGQPIRLVIRPKQETDTALLQKMSPAIESAVKAALDKSGMVVAITDTDSADQIEKYPHSLGTSSLALILSESRQLKILPVDGVMPSLQSLDNGTYPYFKHLYVVASVNPSAGTRQFIEFIQSPQGREILRKTGHRTYVEK